MNLWDWLVVTFTGDDIAILGPRASGKTTLYDYLLGEVGDQHPEQTVGPEAKDAFRNVSLGLSVHKGRDLPGGEHAYAEWQRVFTEASKVFYLFDAYSLRSKEDYAERVARDGRELREWGTTGRRVMMIGTHADTDPICQEQGLTTYSDMILEHDVVAAFRTRVGVQAATVGSLTARSEDIAKVLRRVLD